MDCDVEKLDLFECDKPQKVCGVQPSQRSRTYTGLGERGYFALPEYRLWFDLETDADNYG
ncbi:hypothetical protein AN958_04044 [Leucoagaricus sp. SymC.cos]|nr:hypothetical protein AN958_04044 [Leucoagaricus sp. SymC.cos]